MRYGLNKLKAAFCMVLALLLACAGLYFFIFAPDYSSDWLLSWGERAESRGDKSRAAYFYEQSLALNPYGSQARLRLTALLRSQYKNTRAEELLREGISLQPSNTSFYTELSGLLVEQGRLAEAVESLDGAGSGLSGLRIGALRPAVQASPHAGAYSRPIEFAIETEPGVTYYYTLDGSLPDAESAVYSSPIPLAGGAEYHIRVIALSAGRMPSRLCEYVYDLTACQPSAAAGAVSQPRLHVCPYCGRSFTS